MSRFYEIPEDWKVEDWAGQTALVPPGARGAVTVSFVHRNFNLGWSQVNQTAFHKYQGRNWRQRLINDAVAALNKIYKDEK